jgi:hypothetical protein
MQDAGLRSEIAVYFKPEQFSFLLGALSALVLVFADEIDNKGSV